MVEIIITSRMLIGLRNVILEAVTDLIYAGSAEREGLARQAFACISEFISEPGQVVRSQNNVLNVRSSFSDGDLVLAVVPELVDVLVQAVNHAQDSLLEFEIPIRVMLDPAELSSLGVALDRINGRREP